MLDLYRGRFESRLLHQGDFVICANEQPSIEVRRRSKSRLGYDQNSSHAWRL